MRQIYRFDAFVPPSLSEARLRRELERRKLWRQAALLVLGGLLTLCCIALAALSLYPVLPVLALLCMGYVCVAVAGGAAVMLVFLHRKESLSPCG